MRVVTSGDDGGEPGGGGYRPGVGNLRLGPKGRGLNVPDTCGRGRISRLSSVPREIKMGRGSGWLLTTSGGGVAEGSDRSCAGHPGGRRRPRPGPQGGRGDGSGNATGSHGTWATAGGGSCRENNVPGGRHGRRRRRPPPGAEAHRARPEKPLGVRPPRGASGTVVLSSAPGARPDSDSSALPSYKSRTCPSRAGVLPVQEAPE